MALKINVDKLKEAIEKYQPGVLTCAGINVIYGQARYIGPRVYLKLYKATNNKYYLVKYYQLTRSNNWLKSHGYTMRRKH